jgi:alpha-D-ribose 1-methylphosphonate 5-triphosphate synthase subunit PhnH
LNPASAAIFLTLGNDETTVWSDLNWSFPLIEWFQFQCGCSIVTEPCMASLALITKPIAMPLNRPELYQPVNLYESSIESRSFAFQV